MMRKKSGFRLKNLLTSCVVAAVTAIFCVVGFWRPGLLRGQQNFGHQLGGDLLSDVSGNTIECFTQSIEKFEQSPRWLYAECDVRETRDHHLIVFHDWDISALPNSADNQKNLGASVGNQPICELTLEQIKGLELDCGCQIPTLNQILETACNLKLKKRLLLEFKYIHSDTGRQQLLDLACHYRDNRGLNIHFLAFIRNVQRSFPETDLWLAKFKEHNFCVYQVFRPKTDEYDLCRTWD